MQVGTSGDAHEVENAGRLNLLLQPDSPPGANDVDIAGARVAVVLPHAVNL